MALLYHTIYDSVGTNCDIIVCSVQSAQCFGFGSAESGPETLSRVLVKISGEQWLRWVYEWGKKRKVDQLSPDVWGLRILLCQSAQSRHAGPIILACSTYSAESRCACFTIQFPRSADLGAQAKKYYCTRSAASKWVQVIVLSLVRMCLSWILSIGTRTIGSVWEWMLQPGQPTQGQGIPYRFGVGGSSMLVKNYVLREGSRFDTWCW